MEEYRLAGMKIRRTESVRNPKIHTTLGPDTMPGLNGPSEPVEPARQIRNRLMKAVKSTNRRRRHSMNVKATINELPEAADRL
jgi:hypothetical protein